MLQGTPISPGSFFANQLLSAADNSTKMIVIGGLITPIARSIGIEPNPDYNVSGSEKMALRAFDQMKFCVMEEGRICCICTRKRLLPLPNVNRTTLLKLDNLSFIPDDEELVYPTTPPLLQPHLGASSSSQPSFS